ncbi:MAG: ATP-binding cassette domain-containing protein [Muribaculaceae bacterium]|nr:ATP-binding cassette domain-containing protein [Muribaculaceae bacterium]
MDIELKDIEFSYTGKGAPALQGVTARIAPGIHLLAGENGAGKTTLLHIIAGLRRPTRGLCLIDGADPASDRPGEMGQLFLLEENQEFPGKTIMDFAAQHSRFYPKFSQTDFLYNLGEFGLTGNEPMKKLSVGMKKKAQLSYILALGTPLLLLDEPTNALDIEGRETLRRLIGMQIQPDRTLLISTHSIEQFESLFDGCIVLERSKLVLTATEEEVSSRLAFRNLRESDAEALYTEPQINGTLAITPLHRDDEPTRTDWRMLYSALHSPAQARILESITTKRP